MSISNLLNQLSSHTGDSSSVFNPWSSHDDRDRSSSAEDSAKIRKENLKEFLEARIDDARCILVGEALSNRGGRFTGIAFCSEIELCRKELKLVKSCKGRTTSKTGEEHEDSAKIVWGTVMESKLNPLSVVTWNAFPWHPHKAGVPKSNRPLKVADLEQGQKALRLVIELFPRARVFAVGRRAQTALKRLHSTSDVPYLRHPARGGAADFKRHFKELVLPKMNERSRLSP